MLMQPLSALAWGQTGHRIVGRAAIDMLDETAAEALAGILGEVSAETLDAACNWPDTVRETPEWEWSAPLHYVNIPRHSLHYERERDCRDGLCVSQGIMKYADELGRPGLGAERKWQAFAFLCHLVGDLHQPLHAGFRDDRGANHVEITYRGESWNLHQFWDSVVIRERLSDEETMVGSLASHCIHSARGSWNPAQVAAWTDQSHALVIESAYPAQPDISEKFADTSWLITQEQWQDASIRLALILNAVLGEGEAKLK
jgi:hypothetical protein